MSSNLVTAINTFTSCNSRLTVENIDNTIIDLKKLLNSLLSKREEIKKRVPFTEEKAKSLEEKWGDELYFSVVDPSTVVCKYTGPLNYKYKVGTDEYVIYYRTAFPYVYEMRVDTEGKSFGIHNITSFNHYICNRFSFNEDDHNYNHPHCSNYYCTEEINKHNMCFGDNLFLSYLEKKDITNIDAISFFQGFKNWVSIVNVVDTYSNYAGPAMESTGEPNLFLGNVHQALDDLLVGVVNDEVQQFMTKTRLDTDLAFRYLCAMYLLKPSLVCKDNRLVRPEVLRAAMWDMTCIENMESWFLDDTEADMSQWKIMRELIKEEY